MDPIEKIIFSCLHNNIDFLKALGTDKKFQEFVRKQPSCISGDYDYNDGISQCEYAHVRRINRGSGMGIKPLFSGVPLTHNEHHTQHAKGESSLVSVEQMDKYAEYYRIEWVKDMAKKMGDDKLKKILEDF